MRFNAKEIKKIEAAVECLAGIGMNIKLAKHENGEVELENTDDAVVDIDAIDLDEMSEEELLALRDKLEDYLDDVENETLQDEIEVLLNEIDDLLDE